MVPNPARESYYQLTKALISMGRTRGYVLVDELNSFLPGSASSPQDLETLMTMFGKLAIGVGVTEAEALMAREQSEAEAVFTDAPAKLDKDLEIDIDGPDADKFNDPVRMYLKEMGTVPLLKREDEVEIAKRIEVGVRSVMRALSRSRLASSLLIDIGRMLKENPGIEVVGYFNGNYALGPEQTGVASLLAANPHIDGILTQGYGVGALKALQDAGRPPVPVTAFSYNISGVTCLEPKGAFYLMAELPIGDCEPRSIRRAHSDSPSVPCAPPVAGRPISRLNHSSMSAATVAPIAA